MRDLPNNRKRISKRKRERRERKLKSEEKLAMTKTQFMNLENPEKSLARQRKMLKNKEHQWVLFSLKLSQFQRLLEALSSAKM
jgi:hypothetical protein